MTKRPDPHIGLVIPAFASGGLELVVLDLYRLLNSRGFRATIFVETVRAAKLPADVPETDLVVLEKSEEKFFGEVARRKIRAFHFHYSTFAMTKVKAAGFRTMYTLHNVYAWLDEADFKAHAEAVLTSDVIVAVSQYAADYFVRRAQCAPARVRAIPNGVDIDAARKIAAKSKRQLDLDEGIFLFAQFSSLYRVKHHAVLIAAAERLAGKYKDFQLGFFGAKGDKNYFAEMKEMWGNSSAKSHVKYYGEVTNRDAIAILKGAVDCALLISLQEGCGNAALEAAALDVPLIMTDTGIAGDLKKARLDVDVVRPAVPIDRLTPDLIEQFSRIGATDNLDQIAKAMERRLLAARKKRPAPRKAAFPFTLAETHKAYEALYRGLVRS